MTGTWNRVVRMGAGAFILALAASAALAVEGYGPPAESAPPPAEPEWAKPVPLTFSLDYTLVSDYIFRGANFSEYAGEGREKPNHQATFGVSYDAGDYGTFGFAAWFEWFAGQQALTPGDGSKNLQEVDYTVSWSYDLSKLNASVPLTVDIGWIAYTFPRAAGDAHYTNEWYVSLALDDSALFGTEEPVLNPYFAYYMDVDDVQGSWMELGVSHDFALADCCGDLPCLKDMTVTPSAVLGIDHRYYADSTRLANVVFGLAVSYDLSGALDLPPQYGALTLSGFVNYSQTINDTIRQVLNDEFWGGMSVSYEW